MTTNTTRRRAGATRSVLACTLAAAGSITMAAQAGDDAGCPGSTHIISESVGDVAPGTSIVCYSANTPMASYARVHNMAETDLAGTAVAVHCVDWSLEYLSTGATVTVSLYEGSGSTPEGTLLGTTTVDVDASADVISITAAFDPPISVEADAMIVAVLTMPDLGGTPAYYVGANTMAQESPSWINTGGECGINGWTDLADIGYPQISWVESISASAASGPDPCDEPLDGFPADIDNDTDCDVDDLLSIIGNFGTVGDGSFRPTGDCSPLPMGDCVVNVDDLLECISKFGQRSGACCFSDGTCDEMTSSTCEAAGGTYTDDGVLCGDNPCSSSGGDVLINELRANQSGPDTDEYFELIGEPGASLDDLTFIAIGDGTDDYHGVIEEAVSLDGLTIGDAGFFVVGEPEMIIGTPDYPYELNFEGSDQVTYMLVAGFTGELGTDVDTDNDGVMDVMPWDSILDCVAFVEEVDDYSDHVYCDTTVGPDGIYAPGGARKCDATWYDNGFFPSDFVDTPGNANFCDFTDSDGDGVIDAQDNCPNLANPDQADCDGDGYGDLCAIADGLALDCNENSIPDTCEDDCNFNGIPDDCDIAQGNSSDCDANGIPDECDPDCNGNGVADACDIADGTSLDDNGNGVPDECEGEVFTINEINADPDSTNGDANGDGTPNFSEDEFVEIVNATNSDVFMGGWQIHDAVGLRHEIGNDVVLGPGCALVVFGGGDPALFGDIGGAVVEVASTGYLGFNNTGDTVTLFNAKGEVVAEVAYGSEGGDNQSITRYPDVQGVDFYKHSTVSSTGALFSPGKTIDGTPFGDCGDGGGGEDSDGDGVPDEFDNCDLYNPDQADCNANGIGDVCDIADGTSEDANGDGIPDECQEMAEGVWFNELHYDNGGTDENEFVEVVVLDGVDPAMVTITLYNGNGGNPYGTPLNVAADCTAGDSGDGWTIYYAYVSGIQNGAPDGMCVDVAGSVADFISYEGTIAAATGPAAGMESTDIGVMEGSGTSAASSLGLTGATPSSAIWAEFVDLATPGALNDGQSID